ncbi:MULTISPECIES: response regulator [Paraburkholderia]|uniref:response regulator n=1 Tax=Paraburkholderia TaxID=1822464 RepID=UPI0038BB5CEA
MGAPALTRKPRLLGSAGANGRGALNNAKQIFPSLGLTDLQMPEMDGGQLCRRLKCLPAFAKLPVILLSAVKESPGFPCWDLFIRQPVEMPSLTTTIETLAVAYLMLSRANDAVDYYGGPRLRTINWRCWP